MAKSPLLRLVIIAEESSALHDPERASIRVIEGDLKSPLALDVMKEIIFAGRQVRLNPAGLPELQE
jgi:hypothetical protein